MDSSHNVDDMDTKCPCYRDVKSHHEFISTSNVNWNGIFGMLTPFVCSNIQCALHACALLNAIVIKDYARSNSWIIFTLQSTRTRPGPGPVLRSSQSKPLIYLKYDQVRSTWTPKISGRVSLILETWSAFEQVRLASPYLLVKQFGYPHYWLFNKFITLIYSFLMKMIF